MHPLIKATRFALFLSVSVWSGWGAESYKDAQIGTTKEGSAMGGQLNARLPLKGPKRVAVWQACLALFQALKSKFSCLCLSCF